MFVSSLALYYVHFGPRTEVDCIPAPYAAWSLARHGSFDLSAYPELERFAPGTIAKLADGRAISRVPPESSRVQTPFESFAPERIPVELPRSRLGQGGVPSWGSDRPPQ